MAVGAKNHYDDPRQVLVKKRLDQGLKRMEVSLAGRASVERHVQIVAIPRASTSIAGRTGPWIERSAIAVDRDRQDVFVVEERFGSVAMVTVEVDDRDPSVAKFALERSNRDHHVIERAEAGGSFALGVVQATSRIESTLELPLGHEPCREEGSSNREGRPTPDSTPRGGVAIIEKAGPARVSLPNVCQERGRVNRQQFVVSTWLRSEFDQRVIGDRFANGGVIRRWQQLQVTQKVTTQSVARPRRPHPGKAALAVEWVVQESDRVHLIRLLLGALSKEERRSWVIRCLFDLLGDSLVHFGPNRFGNAVVCRGENFVDLGGRVRTHQNGTDLRISQAVL